MNGQYGKGESTWTYQSSLSSQDELIGKKQDHEFFTKVPSVALLDLSFTLSEQKENVKVLIRRARLSRRIALIATFLR